MSPQIMSDHPSYGQKGGNGLLQPQEPTAFDGWSAHVRYFLARYPLETRQFVAHRLATFGIWSLLASHRQEDLTLDLIASATDSADKDVLTMMREHAKNRRNQSDREGTPAYAHPPPPTTRQAHANLAAGLAPRLALEERERTENVAGRGRAPLARGKRQTVAGRPNVLMRYPFVDDLAEEKGGGVGAALHRAMPTTPVQNLAKREIKRLAHETFSEVKASALGIRLSDLPTALQYLFFGDSASLLGKGAGKGGAGSGDGGAGRDPSTRSAKDVHLVMQLARESLSPTLALAARDTSTLSVTSTQHDLDDNAAWVRDGRNMFINERRWMKLVAHVVRRLWEIDGNPRSDNVDSRGPGGVPPRDPRTANAGSARHAVMVPPPAWGPAGGGYRTATETRRQSVQLHGVDGGEGNVKEAFLGPAEQFRPDSSWGSAASSSVSGKVGKNKSAVDFWVGARPPTARPLGGSEGPKLFDDSGAGEAGWGRGGVHDRGRRGSVGTRGIGGGRGSVGIGGSGVRRRVVNGGGGGKAGTRPAGMWQVTPAPHVAVMGRARHARAAAGNRKNELPAYLRGVRSKIGPQVGVHRERVRKIANARKAAVRDVVARRRLEYLDGGDGCGIGVDSGGDGDGRLPERGHTQGEHALDIADAFLKSNLMTRLAGGDWSIYEDGEQSSSAWEVEGLARTPSSRSEGRRSRGSEVQRLGSEAGARGKNARGQGAARPRLSHTGWLGDFGPPHTHTVKEIGTLDEKDEEGGEGSGVEEGSRGEWGVDNGGDAARKKGQEERDRRGLEASGAATAGSTVGRGSSGVSGDGGFIGVDVSSIGSPGTVDSGLLGSAGWLNASRGKGESMGDGVVLPSSSGVGFYLRDQDASGRASEGGDTSDSGEQEDEKVEMGLTKKDDGAIDPTTGSSGLEEEYLQLQANHGASVGDGEGAGVGGGGTGLRIGSVESSGDGGGWWEQDKSSL